MTTDPDVHVIRMPNLLRTKVGTEPGPDVDEVVAAAEAALAEMKDQYEVWIRDYLKTINEALTAAQSSPQPDPKDLQRIKMMAHEIKGQGATFGYPLLTTVGHMLHSLIDRMGADVAKHMDLIAAHVGFMNLVVGNEVRDDGGIQENQVLMGLEMAVKRAFDG